MVSEEEYKSFAQKKDSMQKPEAQAVGPLGLVSFPRETEGTWMLGGFARLETALHGNLRLGLQ